MSLVVLGIDPGPVTGIVLLSIDQASMKTVGAQIEKAEAIQATADAVIYILGGLWCPPMAIGMERFVVSTRAGRSSTPAAGRMAQTIETRVYNWAMDRDFQPVLRSASEVKPWATDTRLGRAGLLDLTKGMRHARDGARHALFEACKNHGLPDPLSPRAVTR